MKTHVEFQSGAFPAYKGEEDEINPGRWGKRLAEFLKSQLEEANIATGEIYFEDWGVALPIQNEQFPMWVGCGNCDDHEDTFLCFIEPSKPTIRRWFRKIHTAPRIKQVSAALNKILVSSAEIQNIRWWAENEGPHLTDCGDISS